jgi:membrane peptidoglycan carboxypeptidase
VQYAKRQLEDLLGANLVARGGLDVITTLDADLQTQMQCAADKELLQIITGQSAAASSDDCLQQVTSPPKSLIGRVTPI